MVRRTLRLLGAAALLAAPVAARAQEQERCKATATPPEVRSLSFEGNSVYKDAVLANGVFTEPSPFLRRMFPFVGTGRIARFFFGRPRFLNQIEFCSDVQRLLYQYRMSGYPGVQVDTVVRPISARAVAVTFVIREGQPMVVDTLRITGLDSVLDRKTVLARLPLRQDSAFNRFKYQATIDSITRRLRDAGYPGADVLRSSATDTSRRRATVDLDVAPGTRARLGDFQIEVLPRAGATQQISNQVVQGLLGVRKGSVYRESQLERAKRNLYLTTAYRAVLVDVDSADVARGDSLVTIHVKLTEDFMRSGRVSVGWGTLDCVRTEGDYQNYNFMSRALRFEARARFSKILIGQPFGGAEALCDRSLRGDPYSSTLNHYIGVTFAEPTASRLGFRPSLTLYTERRSEYKAFMRATPAGFLVAATRPMTRGTMTFGYQGEYGHTEAQPAIFCALQNLCLASDREPLLASRWLATVSWGIEQRWSNDPQYPTRTASARLELRHASTVVGSDPHVQFSKATADLSAQFNVGHGMVLAPRIRAGAVVGPAFSGTSSFIPPQERLFAGGWNSLRGFDQNDLGPKVYIAQAYDTVRAPGATGGIAPNEVVYFRTPNGSAAERSVPTGGSALVVGNVELRVPIPGVPDLLQLAVFADAGELWSPGSAQPEDRFKSIKLTPGLGLRAATPLGVFRVDLAYNRYAPRAGASFFDAPIGQGGQLYCVSPGNSLAVTGANPGSIAVQASGTCVADFRPPSVTSFFRRLTLSAGIGQAY
jgi:outer membrane protein assembly factor BamA